MSADTLPEGFVDRLFAAIDRKDVVAFAEFLTEDATFRFGSAPPVTGRAAVQSAVAAFFASIDGLSHSITHICGDASTMACEGEVCYRRLDGREVIVPFVDVFECTDGQISAYKIYIDIAPLYAN